MVPNMRGGARIVRTWGGHSTGETIYEDERGRLWTTEAAPIGTGDSRAVLRRGRIYPGGAPVTERKQQKGLA